MNEPDRYQRHADFLKTRRTRIVKTELANLESGIRRHKGPDGRPDLLAAMQTRHKALALELARLTEEAP